jgi:hypothetical protein
LNVDCSDYKEKETIHLLIQVVDGEMDKLIHFGFSNEEPNESTSLPYTVNTKASHHYCSGEDSDNECGHEYYYDIEKKENTKFMRIKITGYTGSSLYVVKTIASFYTTLIIFGVITLLLIIVTIYCRCRYSRRKSTSIESQKNLMPSEDTPYSNYDNININNTSETKPDTI